MELSRPNVLARDVWRDEVTRLGEFAPNGWLFTLGIFMKIAEAAHIFGLPFSTIKVMQ
jgi:hypothetical protein